MADNTVSGKEETPVPGTAAQDGRRKLGAYGAEHRSVAAEIQSVFYTQVRREVERRTRSLRGWLGAFGNRSCGARSWESARRKSRKLTNGNSNQRFWRIKSLPR